ncbi:MAG: S9 family peptidase [Sphingobacteriales bacterium]|nr:S9 family peptidase [Sphingobacteriales bacterium]
MKRQIILLSLLMMTFSCKKKQEEAKFIYPETRKSDHVDTYFGQQVPDPYNWLEDDTAAEVVAWVKAQNKVTNAYLEKIPYREKIRKRLTELWNYPRYSVPFHAAEKYFLLKNDGLQQQSVLYMMRGPDGKEELLLDPNKFSEDGTVALSDIEPSPDGKYLAYGIARAGSDWNEIYVLDLETGKKLDDKLEWIKFSGVAWYKNGFFYSRFDKPVKGKEFSEKNKNHKVYYHTLGTSQSKDQLVYRDNQHPFRTFSADVTEDQRFLIIYGSESTNGNSVMYKNLEKSDKEFTVLEPGFEFENTVIQNIGDTLLMKTNNGAPNYKLVSINTAEKENVIRDLIPQKDYPLVNVVLMKNNLITVYIQDVVSKIYRYSPDGRMLEEIKLPGPGNLTGFNARKDDTIAFFGFTSFTFPSTVFKYDLMKNSVSVFRKSEINFDLSKYKTEQVFYLSKDGTKVPMFLTYRKDLEKNGKNPVLLYGYGGFNISLMPNFSVSSLILLENGGIFAYCNLRGGGEYGEKWHEAGMRENKQNVFDDFIAAAEYLIKEKYTSADKIAIRGGSNGGLLVGACMTQRPDLFKVAIPEVGVLDMLKYHKFTIGGHWVDEYGSSDNEEQFRYLIKYSPLHNIRENVEYPATLVTTADHDDRVVPAHSFKFIATLQEKYKGNNPVMIRIEEKAGHGAGTPVSKTIDLNTDIWAFIFYNLGIQPNY